MNIRKLFDLSFWKVNNKEYKSLLSYDYSFNAVFRGEKMLSKDDLELREIRYLKLYRHAQCARDTIWHKYFYHRLVKYSYKTGIGLYENMNLPKGLIIGHAGTIVINGNATFRGNLFLTHGVTIGRDVRGKRKGTPKFGRNVCIRANSTIVGNITIGDDVLIAPNTFVNFDVPSHSIVIGNPASIHYRDWATEGHLGGKL